MHYFIGGNIPAGAEALWPSRAGLPGGATPGAAAAPPGARLPFIWAALALTPASSAFCFALFLACQGE